MRFSMSDDEIRSSFNTARNKKDQVKILAELNATTPQAMAEKLRELGCDVPELPVTAQKPLRAKEALFDENRARALFDEGKSDLDCAEMLGCSVYAFATWRRKNGMKRPMGGACPRKPRAVSALKTCTTQTPVMPETAPSGSHSQLPAAETQISAAALGEVLLDLANRYPGLVLTVNGAAVRALCLNVRMLMGEEPTTSTLNLEVG